MNQIDFRTALEYIRPYVVQISTPSGTGTGFLFAQSQDHTMVGIATAAHVVRYAHLWEQPIKIQHHESGKIQMLRVPDRAILLEHDIDTAAIVFKPGDIPFPESEPKLSPKGKYLKVAFEIGWVGFPALSPSDLASSRAGLAPGSTRNGRTLWTVWL